MVLLNLSIISARRERLAGEIIPVSAQQSRTYYGDEKTYGAANAIDLDFQTKSDTTKGSDGTSWLKLTLGQLYCVEQAVEFESDGTTRQHTWTCTNSDCSNCVGQSCQRFPLTVTSEKAAADNLPPVSNCKYGDTVTLTEINGGYIGVWEIAVIGKQGETMY